MHACMSILLEMTHRRKQLNIRQYAEIITNLNFYLKNLDMAYI